MKGRGFDEIISYLSSRGIAVAGFLLLVLCGVSCQHSSSPEATPTPVRAVTIRVIHGPELQDYMAQIKGLFDATEHKLFDGTLVKLQPTVELGIAAAHALASGELKGEAWIPSSTSLLNLANSTIKNLGARHEACQALFGTPFVIATREKNLEAFHGRERFTSWGEFAQSKLVVNAGSEVDQLAVSFNFTHPRFSVTGFGALVQLAYWTTPEIQGGLGLEALESSSAVQGLSDVQGFVSDYPTSEEKLLERVAQAEIRRVRFSITTEQQLMLFNSKPPSGSEPLVGLYPQEGSYWEDYQICESNADWVTPQHRAALKIFEEFLQGEGAQRAAGMAGFRLAAQKSGNTPKALAGPLTDPRLGATPTLPSKSLQPVQGAVVQKLFDLWPKLMRPQAVMMVVDTSGSMEGEPLNRTVSEFRNLVARLGERDLKGLISFANTPEIGAEFTPDSQRVFPVLDRLVAVGGSAVYDAIRAAVQVTTAADLERYRKTIVIVTDGGDRNSEVSLFSLNELLRDKFSRNDINLILIGLTSAKEDLSVLRDMAKAIGGNYRECAPEGLPKVFAELLKDLQGA